jgi:hypothetical protein
MNILTDILAEVERGTPFEAAQDRADMFAVNLFLSYSMNECIKDSLNGTADALQAFEKKMLLAAKTLEAMNVSA